MRLPAHIFRSTARDARRHKGMTLVELIVVITISGIISSILVFFIVGSMQGYEAQVRRAELVDAAEMALRRMGRDIRQALPNSVRVDATGRVIEMLNTVDGARYRDGPGNIAHNHGPTEYRLRIPGTDSDGFNIVGFFQNLPGPLPFNSTSERLAIYNQTVTGTTGNAYYDGDESLPAPASYVITRPSVTTFGIDLDGDNPCSPGIANPNGDDEHCIKPSSSFKFRYASPNQRVYIVDTPVSYVCTPGNGGNIARYSSYAITSAQPTNPSAAPLSAATNIALLSTPVTACTFTYSPGTNQRAGLVTLDITVSDTASGDVVRLLYQAHVDNSP
ncbi:MAG: prepilin-type N-terminal cleavage/methylation domain-containing protein [Pseudomonadota bacterium]